MSREEMLELVRDLERAGVRIDRIERQPYPCEDLWQIVCWCDNARMHYTITDAGRFRSAVQAGLTPVMTQSALDRPGSGRAHSARK